MATKTVIVKVQLPKFPSTPGKGQPLVWNQDKSIVRRQDIPMSVFKKIKKGGKQCGFFRAAYDDVTDTWDVRGEASTQEHGW